MAGPADGAANARPFEFDAGVAVERLDDGRWLGAVDPRWTIGLAPNGGYLVCVALAAVGRTVGHPDPFAVSAHFPSRTRPGPVEVRTETIREGRGLSTVHARLAQGPYTRVVLTATFGDLDQVAGPTSIQTERPEFPSPEECVRAEGPNAPEFMRRFDLRLTPASAAWATTGPSGIAEASGWIRFADDRPPDVASLPLMADAFPPTVFNVLTSTWVPTLELTVHVRGRPAPGWLQCRFRTRYLIDGYLEEDGEIWDSTGRLVALSRQMARVMA